MDPFTFVVRFRAAHFRLSDCLVAAWSHSAPDARQYRLAKLDKDATI
jgi:hypothetical protein